MRIFGILDIGSNAIRAELFNLESDSVSRLDSSSELTHIGKALFGPDRLQASVVTNIVAAVSRSVERLRTQGAEEIIAVATAAFRESDQSASIFAAIEEHTQVPVRLLSGCEEAVLIAKGIHAHELDLTGDHALIDIGGGSTEVSICAGSEVRAATSFPCGTARFTIPKLGDPDSSHEEAVQKQIRKVFDSREFAWQTVPVLVCSSFTARTLAAFARSCDQSEAIVDVLEGLLHSSDRVALLSRCAGETAPGRMEKLLIGAYIMLEVAARLETETLRVTEYSLRHGVVREVLDGLSAK